MLLESTNNSVVFLRPHYEAHSKYTIGIDKTSCRFVTEMVYHQCEFVQNTKSCHEFEGFFDYSYLIYCVVIRSAGSNHAVFSYILLSFLALVYAGFVSNIAYTKTGPNLIAIMKYIKLSENTTGVIIMSTIFSMPSLIEGYSYRLLNSDSELYVTLILGKDLIAKTFVVGFLLIFYPITLYPRYLLRDISFFLLLFCAFIYILDNEYTPRSPLFYGIILVSVWLVYCVVVLAEDMFYLTIYKGVLDDHQIPFSHQSRNRELIVFKSANYRVFAQFLNKFNPLKNEKFYTQHRWLKITYFIFFPLRIIINLVIPGVDYQLRHNGWSKLFNCINLVTLPLFVMVLFKFSMQLMFYVSLFNILLAIIVFLTSRTDRPPRYHYIFAIYGLFGAIVISFYLSVELLGVLNLAGITLGIRRGAMALLLHTVADTLELFVIGMSIAKIGYPNISYAIFRTCGFMEMVGMGTTFLSTAFIDNSKKIVLRPGVYGQTAIYFIFIETAATIITAIVTNFQLRISVGWFFIIYYIFTVLFIITIQIEFVHPLGTDHTRYLPGWEHTNWA